MAPFDAHDIQYTTRTIDYGPYFFSISGPTIQRLIFSYFDKLDMSLDITHPIPIVCTQAPVHNTVICAQVLEYMAQWANITAARPSRMEGPRNLKLEFKNEIKNSWKENKRTREPENQFGKPAAFSRETQTIQTFSQHQPPRVSVQLALRRITLQVFVSPAVLAPTYRRVKTLTVVSLTV